MVASSGMPPSSRSRLAAAPAANTTDPSGLTAAAVPNAPRSALVKRASQSLVPLAAVALRTAAGEAEAAVPVAASASPAIAAVTRASGRAEGFTVASRGLRAERCRICPIRGSSWFRVPTTPPPRWRCKRGPGNGCPQCPGNAGIDGNGVRKKDAPPGRPVDTAPRPGRGHPGTRRALAEQLPGDDRALDFRGTLVDARGPDLPVQVLQQVATL